MKLATILFLSCTLQAYTKVIKRQYIDDAVTIDKWSGPFFNNKQQKDAFDQLLHDDSRGSKRMDLGGIDPNDILNPVPERPRVRTVKDEGPVAETYIGKDPDADKIAVASPQDRLAHFVSKPIIHNAPIERNMAKHLHDHDMEDNPLHSRLFMFRHQMESDEGLRDHDRHRFREDDRFDEEKRRHHVNDRTDDRQEQNFRENENDESPPERFISHHHESFEQDRDQDKSISDESDKRYAKRSVIKKHKQHKKVKHPFEKKSEFSAVGSHIPEVLMPGGLLDAGVPSTTDEMIQEGAIDPSLRDSNGSPLSPILTGGDSDIAVTGNTPMALTGVGVNSHSGVKEISEHLQQTEDSDMTNADDGHPIISNPNSKQISEKVINNEATFQGETGDTRTPDGQGKEPVDQHTIFVQHHQGKPGEEENLKEREASRRSHAKKHQVHKIRAKEMKGKSHHNKRSNLAKILPVARKNQVAKLSKNSSKRWTHSTWPQHGFLEDNVANDYNNRVGGGPHLMTVGHQDEGDGIQKEWNNMHSPGNGYYSGAGLGPSRSLEGEYIHHSSHYAPVFPAAHGFHGHGPAFGGGGGGGGGNMNGFAEGGHMEAFSGGHGMEGYMDHTMEGDHGMDGGNAVGHGIFGGLAEGHMGNDNAMHSLSSSGSSSDHDTAGLIGAIWDHDYDGEHGRGAHVGYYGHNDLGTLLPSETLDGFAGSEHGGFSMPMHGRYHGGSHWSGGIGSAVVHEGHSSAIQDIQDDTSIDSSLQTMGIGMEMNGHHGHHGHHGMGPPFMEHHDVGQYANEFHGAPDEGHGHIVPVNDHHHEMSPEQYHDHIDALMLKYHKLEEDMRGTHGNLMDRLDENLLHHHGHPHYHSGYDIYSFKNPWDNARIPYHVPVENHPDNTPEEEHVGGGSMEMGGKDDGKGEEKGGPLVEAKEESKPPPKKEDDKKDEKEEKKPEKKPEKPEKPEKPDWTGIPPKIPAQRGGPEISGSIGLASNESIADAGLSKLAPLQQAIMAYKAMNLTVPASLQIQELKEELKMERAKEASLVASHDSHETASAKDKEPPTAKDKEPPKQAETPNGAAEVTKAIQQMGSRAASYNIHAAPQFQRLQQLNFLQQSYLKQMLDDAVTATKISQKPVQKEDNEQATVENILGLGHASDKPVQSAQLLGLLNNMLKQGASNVAFSNLAKAVQGTSNFVKQPSTEEPAAATIKSEPVSADSKSSGVDKTSSLTSLVTGASSLTPSEVPTLDVPDNEQENIANETESNENNDLISLLNTAGIARHKKKHHKKKHNVDSDDAYAKIGYEGPTGGDSYKVGVKKDTSSPVTGDHNKAYVTLKDISSAESTVDVNANDEASKKTNIKTDLKTQ